MAKPLRLLSIGAHPADVFDQCGGTLAHHVERGDQVSCAVLTHGARIHDVVISDSMYHREQVPQGDELEGMISMQADAKADEVREACAILGVTDVHFLGADDAILLVERETIRDVARLIRELRPHIVITHFPREGDGQANPHAVAGQIVMHAIAAAGGVDPEDSRPPHRVAQIFCFGEGAAHLRSGLAGAAGGFTMDVFVDITDVVEKKLATLDSMVSQGYGGAYARKRIETSDGAMGMMGGACPYAEGFISWHPQIHRHLPLTEPMLEMTELSDHDLTYRGVYRVPVD